MNRLFQIDTGDNVAVTFSVLEPGMLVEVPGHEPLRILDKIPAAHKIALEDIPAGCRVIKYGALIGVAAKNISRGELVHTENLQTCLDSHKEYRYHPRQAKITPFHLDLEQQLRVFRRRNGQVGIRNELWVIPTVGCVNSVARNIVSAFRENNRHPDVDGVYYFTHPYGCSQLGEDHELTKKILQNIALNPNSGGVLILGLGCENNQIDVFRASMPAGVDTERLRFLEAQAVEDEIAAGVELLHELYNKAAQDVREPGFWHDITVGLECGGSDALSGITANPLIGRASDYIVAHGGTTVLTEVPEMFGAEHFLMEQCSSREIFSATVSMINHFKDDYLAHGQPVYENPSPGNKSGGISTLEDKSLGCIRKAGKAPVVDVIKMDQRVKKSGLNLLYSPGNDLIATTTLGAAGCQLVLFSTGRGTPLGGFIPTIKIASNSELAQKKSRWIDFDAGVLTRPDINPDDVLTELLKTIVAVINGEATAAEKRNDREIAILKTGVTL